MAGLLLCYGKKAVGEAVGTAEAGHAVCQPCLERWFQAQQDLREAEGLPPAGRRVCPCCHCELRAVRGGGRREERYAMGLLKVHGTWPEDGAAAEDGAAVPMATPLLLVNPADHASPGEAALL